MVTPTAQRDVAFGARTRDKLVTLADTHLGPWQRAAAWIGAAWTRS